MLRLNAYEVWINLGTSKEEQGFLQPVHFNLTIHFEKAVKGCVTDHLADAIDYVTLTSHVAKSATQKPFCLIEHLCFLVHQDLSAYIKSLGYTGELVTQVHKLRPPIKSLEGGVDFTCQSAL